jgi:hypothetical protein
MNRKLSILILSVCFIGCLAFCVANRIAAASEPPKSTADSIKDLNDRIRELEKQVADLRAQMKELNSKKFPGVLTIPKPKVFPGNQIPPGATEHEFNGIKYWMVPLKDSK